MAIAKPGPLVTAISGAAGGSIFSIGRNGQVVGPRPGKVQPATQWRMLAHARYITARSAWRQMDSAQRAAWVALAARIYTTNRLGVLRAPNGYALAVKHNIFRLESGQSVVFDPPANLSSAARPIFDAVLTYDAPNDQYGMTIVATPDCLTSPAALFLYARQLLPASAPSPGQPLKFLGADEFGGYSNTFLHVISDRFGDPPPSPRYALHLRTMEPDSLISPISAAFWTL